MFSAALVSPPLIIDMSLDKIVHSAFDTIGHEDDDTSPQNLRSTYSRRTLLQGISPAVVSLRRGQSSNPTVHRMLATIEVV